VQVDTPSELLSTKTLNYSTKLHSIRGDAESFGTTILGSHGLPRGLAFHELSALFLSDRSGDRPRSEGSAAMGGTPADLDQVDLALGEKAGEALMGEKGTAH
jgi:hypothetical protein